MVVRDITIIKGNGNFSIFKRKDSKQEYDFSGILALRQLLNNGKARILHVIKIQKPQSIYELAKKLGRGFKAVNDDIKLLERFGFIELIPEYDLCFILFSLPCLTKPHSAVPHTTAQDLVNMIPYLTLQNLTIPSCTQPLLAVNMI